MQGLSEVIIEDFQNVIDNKGMKTLNRIKDAVVKMDKMILDLIVHSQMVRKKIELSKINLEFYVSNAIKENQVIIKEKKIDVKIELIFCYAIGSELIVEQLLNNLLGNAIKFTDDTKSPKIKIWTEIKENKIRLSIEDNGIGIEERYFKKIFNVFERLHGEEHYPGTGIGLAIVKSGVEKLGGKCGVDSNFGEFSNYG